MSYLKEYKDLEELHNLINDLYHCIVSPYLYPVGAPDNETQLGCYLNFNHTQKIALQKPIQSVLHTLRSQMNLIEVSKQEFLDITKFNYISSTVSGSSFIYFENVSSVHSGNNIQSKNFNLLRDSIISRNHKNNLLIFECPRQGFYLIDVDKIHAIVDGNQKHNIDGKKYCDSIIMFKDGSKLFYRDEGSSTHFKASFNNYKKTLEIIKSL